MNKIIGGGPTGRLFIHLREEKGYTYGASSGLVAPLYRGEWQASTNVRTEVTEPALHDLLDEIRQIREEPVSDEELADAKRSLTAQYALELESPSQLLGIIGEPVALQASDRLLRSLCRANQRGDEGAGSGDGEEVSRR